MSFRHQRLLRALPILFVLGCGGGGSDGGPADVPVIVLSQSALSLIEGTPETLTVVLDAAPQANVSVALASAGRVTVLPTTLDFTPANFATPKSVIVTPLQDADLAPGVDTISATATGLGTVKIPVAIADNDSQAVLLGTDSLTILEGDTASFTVRLAYQPAGNVTVDLGPLDTNVTVSQSAASFTTSNWDTPVRITVTAHDDADLGDESTFVAAGIASGPTSIVYITVDDDDQQAVILNTDSLTILEGDTASFTVRLAYQPASGVTVDLGPLDTNVTVSQSAASFTTSNWDTPVRITVTAHHDTDLGDEATFVAAGIASGPTSIVYITVDDDDVQAIETSANLVEVTEGDTAGLGVRLAFQPASDLTIFATSLVPSTVTVQPSSRTFTPANWDTYQYVTVSGSQDPDLLGSTVSVRLTGATVTQKDVAVHVTDDDTQAFVTSVDTVFVTEGLDATVTITLAFQPPSNVTAVLTIDGVVATANPTTLTSFTPANYSAGFTVIIHGTEDANTVTDGTMLTIQGTGVPAKSILVIVADND